MPYIQKAFGLAIFLLMAGIMVVPCAIAQESTYASDSYHDTNKLTGKHKRQECGACHKKADEKDFSGLNEDCASCHNDIHDGELSQKCDTCHSPKGWRGFDVKLDHDKAFKLTGKHIFAKCRSCHTETGKFGVSNKGGKCTDCHDDKDKHSGAYGEYCGTCHTAESWEPTDEGVAKIEKKKAKIKEEELAKVKATQSKSRPTVDKNHSESIKEEVAKKGCDSFACHKTEGKKAHDRQFRRDACSNCHASGAKWKDSFFEHNRYDKSGMSFTGKHADVECKVCHRTNKVKDIVIYKPIKRPKNCGKSGCHEVKKNLEIHGRQFMRRDCGQCHTVKEWIPSTFSHFRADYRRYRLKGKHVYLNCISCHKENKDGQTIFRPIQKNYCNNATCHDTEHNSIFGEKDCEGCHSEDGWTKLTFEHNKQSKYKLEGVHNQTNCELCHVDKKWKGIETGCISCHGERDPHEGKMGKDCAECHTAHVWTPKGFEHQLTGFPIKGSHVRLDCEDCHYAKGEYSGGGPECASCHTDPHLNQFGSLCGDCHTDRYWTPHKFRHGDTAFRLEGAHRVADCKSCHKNRFYRNTPIECVQCHHSEFTSYPDKHSSGNIECLDCHKTFSWVPAFTPQLSAPAEEENTYP